MADFLLEILSEEIPASMQRRAADSLRGILTERLREQGLEGSAAQCLVTPRRLVLHLAGLPDRQPDIDVERKGPRLGAPAKAVEGFARSAGLAAGDLTERTTAKGTFWFAVATRKGRATSDVLADAVPDAMASLAWPKSMRWADEEVRWVRPLVSILALLDGSVVPFRFGRVESGATTRGHRFLCPEPLAVKDFPDYRDKLACAFVVPCHGERRALIEERAGSLARDLGLAPDLPPALVDELAGLVEWPVVMAGAFDPAFLDVPEELVTTEMIHHQRYIPLREGSGALAPRFLFVANMEGRDGGRTIRRGNERVLAARLADGRHFWDRDRERGLSGRVEELQAMVFHARLGTVGDRVLRLQGLAAWLAPRIPDCDPALAGRAAWLAKADLASGTVAEFPELQGVMGGHLARAEGEHEAVAAAIAEHYSPRGPSDACPSAPVSMAVALAERLDSLWGFFSVGEKPTGSRDPFALRRAALGLLRLVLENGLRLPLRQAFAAARDGYGEGPDVAGELIDFLADRLKVHLRGEGIGHDLIDAVFSRDPDDDFVRLLARVTALRAFLATADGGNLLEAYRRAANIVRIEEARDGRVFDGAVSADLLIEEEEKAVATALEDTGQAVSEALDGERFGQAMEALASLRASVGAFFDEVIVNAPDPALRENRLNLLGAIRSTMDRVADFSRIEG